MIKSIRRRLADIWRGTTPLPSWEAACKRAASYDSDNLNKFRIERGEWRPPAGSLLLGNVLGLAAKIANKPDLAITDFGGSTGDLGRDFMEDYPASRYVVVEHQKLVSLIKNTGGIEFATAIPAQCDIFYSSGTLQYLSEPKRVLEAAFASAALAVVLVRNSFSETETFYIQRSRLFDNGGGPIPKGYSDRWISYPHRTLVESDIIGMASESGFRCIARLDESKAFPRSYSKQLVFWRT